jgi:hypothetical protein
MPLYAARQEAGEAGGEAGVDTDLTPSVDEGEHLRIHIPAEVAVDELEPAVGQFEGKQAGGEARLDGISNSWLNFSVGGVE